MQILRNKTKIAIALFLVLSFAVSMLAVFPNVKGQIVKKPDRDTSAYISVNPDLIGINQELTVNMFVLPSPNGPNFEMGATFRWYYHNLTATFTRPDGSKDTFKPLHESSYALGLEPGQTEEVGAIWFFYKPNQLGTWSLSFSFPGETYTALNFSVFYKPSTSQTITFEVQEDNVQIGLPPVQLPTGYWERPINAENREWSQISGDWIPQVASIYGSTLNFNPYTTAPNSAHILWTNEVARGGLVGGEFGGISYGAGGGTPSYIIDGCAYYTYTTVGGTMMRSVDLRTGKLLWEAPGSINYASNFVPPHTAVQEFGGSPTPYLWSYSATAGWVQYDAYNGRLLRTIKTNIANLGTTPVWLDANICYVLQQGTWNPTTMRRPFNWLIKWNLSKVTGDNWPTGIVWNVTVKQSDGTGPGEGSRGSAISLYPDVGIAMISTMGESMFYGYNMDTGAFQWKYDVGFLVMKPVFDPYLNMLLTSDSALRVLHGYSVSSSSMTESWENQVGDYPWGSFLLTSATQTSAIAYGNLYAGSYDGYLYCIDEATGDVEWRFYAGNTTETVFATWAQCSVIVGGGKVYVGTSEHTPTQPRTRGNKLFCVDALTGEGIWNISIAGSSAPKSIADGYLLSINEYTGLLYCFGKGKTETAVTASPKASVMGSKVVIEGSVLDMSPASAGTPAISDADMNAWMNYVHMQRPEPMTSPDGDSWGTPVDVKGVEVSLDAIDPNNNFIHIGTATSDSSGTYGLAFNPEVPGLYKVIATFAGSESYWASYAETFVNVEEASTVTPPAEQVPTDFMPVYTAVIGVGIAIIVAIAIAVVLLLRKR